MGGDAICHRYGSRILSKAGKSHHQLFLRRPNSTKLLSCENDTKIVRLLVMCNMARRIIFDLIKPFTSSLKFGELQIHPRSYGFRSPSTIAIELRTTISIQTAPALQSLNRQQILFSPSTISPFPRINYLLQKNTSLRPRCTY